MRWDAFVYVTDPDALAAEFADRFSEHLSEQRVADSGAAFSVPLKDTHDGFAGSRFATLTATSCSSIDQCRQQGSDAGVNECNRLFSIVTTE
jgi:hypothetical protein